MPSLLRRENFCFFFSHSYSLLRERASFRQAFFFFSCTTTMLVGRAFRPLPSTPESHSPAVVTGLYEDLGFFGRWVEDAGERERSEAAVSADGMGASV